MTAPLEEAIEKALRAFPVPATYEEWQAAVDRSYEGDAAFVVAHLRNDDALREAATQAVEQALAERGWVLDGPEPPDDPIAAFSGAILHRLTSDKEGAA